MKLPAVMLFVLLLFTLGAAAEVGPMNYQGRLLDSNGIPVDDPAVTFVVRIYDDPLSGTLKFEETHAEIDVDDGVYSFLVSEGDRTPFYIGVWDVALWNESALYLEIEANGEVLSPRTRLTAAPYAFQANLALSADALGNKQASEFDNILEGICIASEGKWLDKLETCLGVGAVINSQAMADMFVDPAVNYDFSELDLRKADLTGTSFADCAPSDCDFSNTILDGAILMPAGLNNTNLTSASLDGVSFSGAVSSPIVNLTEATIKNADLSGINLQNATLTGLSAAELIACPAGLPGGWSCLLMRSSGSPRYFLAGPFADFSAGSAITVNRAGRYYLNVDKNVFDGVNVPYSNFSGLYINNVDFKNCYLNNTNFDSAVLSGITLENNVFVDSSFANSTWSNMVVNSTGAVGDNEFGLVDFSGAHLENVFFILNNHGHMHDVFFYDASFNNVYFDRVGNVWFNYSTINDLIIEHVYDSTQVNFSGSEISGDLNLGIHSNAYVFVTNATIINAIIKATWLGEASRAVPMSIAGNNVRYVVFNGSFQGTAFNANTFYATTFKGDYDTAIFTNNSFQNSVISGAAVNFWGANTPCPEGGTTGSPGLIPETSSTGCDLNSGGGSGNTYP